VLPGSVRRGKVIKLHLMYIGRENLTGVQVAVGSDHPHEHIVGLSTEGGPHYHQWDKLGDLAAGDEFWITILTEDVFDHLTFSLDLNFNRDMVAKTASERRLVVRAPLPTSVPVVTERPTP
jgi:hypothetical protein